MRFVSRSAAQTKKLAAQIARKVMDQKPGRNARVLALTGELGAGKTTFVQGFAKALGIKHRMVSPTFLIIRNYQLRITNYRMLWHIDAYRLRDAKELLPLDFKDILKDRHNILVIEWAEKIKKLLPKDAIWVRCEHGRKENERILTISNL